MSIIEKKEKSNNFETKKQIKLFYFQLVSLFSLDVPL
jgi:hypothetical protein